MNWNMQRIIIVLAAVVAVVLLVWALQNNQGQPTTQPESTDPSRPAPHGTVTTEPTVTPTTAPAVTPTTQAVEPPQPVHLPDDDAAAADAYRRGLELLADKQWLAARETLSAALLSGHLAGARAEDAREQLELLVDKTIFSPSVYDDDPYTFRYQVKAGDMLSQIERRFELHTPIELILRINRMSDARKLKARQTLKLVRGPFHAVVNKRTLIMDLYLHREGLSPVYVRQLRVGLGRDDGTPAGLWRIRHGEKGRRVSWYPPPSSGLKGRIDWGEPGYAFGEKGIWLPLEGIDENTEGLVGYGIHSTNNPLSVGRTVSLGCIRLLDDDIELVYALLYEKWSTVRVTR